MKKYFFGVDVGTQGARIILVDQEGNNIASASRKFVLDDKFREEQDPLVWWNDCVELIDQIISDLPRNFQRNNIVSISVTSTSGTVIPLDKCYNPLHKAIMYSDGRSVHQGLKVKDAATKYVPNGYTGFNASSGISKMLWFVETFPELAGNIDLWVHASDFIVGKLSNNYCVTDYTNVLKSGFDLEKLCWPDYIFDELGLNRDCLQEVVPSGTIIGKLLPELANRWSIPQIEVVVGITDGCASQMASGAVNIGDWNTTIGTTLVIKGVTKNQLIDPLGRLYSHRHPLGYWMPGGASNTGADWISIDFDEDLDLLNDAASTLVPTGLLAWPLKQKGERYPIMSVDAREIIPENVDKYKLYAANLEGVAFIEKLAYEIIEDLSGEKVGKVFTAGGGSNSDIWLAIRASVLNVPILKCKESSGALGAAIMAASNTYYNSITEAAQQMTTIEKEVLPNTDFVKAYEIQYVAFKEKLKSLKYI